MSKYNIIIALIFLTFISLSSTAQVTIGSSSKPANGALLDLKESNSSGENSSRGLGLPRVQLEKAAELIPLTSEPNVEKQHTGIMVYNVAYVALENLCPGLYVWDGSLWNRLHGSCLPVSFSDVANEYVMDGLEYSFTINAFEDWETSVSDPENILTSIPNGSGSSGEYQFKFTLPVKMDADATAEITFKYKDRPEISSMTTIVGKKMIFLLSDNQAIVEKGEEEVIVPFSIETNSTRPITIVGDGESGEIEYNSENKIITIRLSNPFVGGRFYDFNVSNGATTEILRVTVES